MRSACRSSSVAGADGATALARAALKAASLRSPPAVATGWPSTSMDSFTEGMSVTPRRCWFGGQEAFSDRRLEVVQGRDALLLPGSPGKAPGECVVGLADDSSAPEARDRV